MQRDLGTRLRMFVGLDVRKERKPLKNFKQKSDTTDAHFCQEVMGFPFTEIWNSGRKPSLKSKLMNLVWVQLGQKKKIKSKLDLLSRSKTSNPGLQTNLELLQGVHKCLIQISFQEIHGSY